MLARNAVRPITRAAVRSTAAPSTSAGARTAAVSRAGYRGYSSSSVTRQQAASSSSSSSNSGSSGGSRSSGNGQAGRNKATPYAFGLIGGITSYLGFGTQKNEETTQEGTLKPGSKVDYNQVYKDVAAILEDENYDDGSYGPTLVRLAWHCSGTYDKNSGNGGSNGATMRFAAEANHGANAGLKVVRDLLDPIKQKYPGLSYSDLWTLAGVVAIQEMGGPKIPWRSGREDGTADNCTPDGRLPDGDKGADHIRYIFYKMGFNDQEIVALSGAHALGRCHTDRSGFDGPWTYSPITFSNQYYQLLFDEKWNLRKWDGPIQYENTKGKNLMMLTTDYALTTEKGFREHAERYAKSEEEFFKDFSKAFAKLIELGVPEKNWNGPPMVLGD